MLDTLRIKAESIVLPWDHVVCHFGQNGQAINTQRPTIDLSASYLSAFNDMIKRNSEEAAITLLNLPLPPDNAELLAERYLEQIRRLTDSLPPTLLVHGVSSVISTAL
uniref:SLC12 domain-containing protein n=1 Tax=Heterorhabditis bacteriophora TaxID=37862 RepID=A0A1I7XU76_HETBA